MNEREQYDSRLQKGFTLIELLVVIAIIGLLSSVVLASLNGARKKGRNARRMADLKQLQVALELYFDTNRTYPVSAASPAVTVTTALAGLAPAFISTIPNDPLGGAYIYGYRSSADGLNYCIGSIIEGTAPAGALGCNTAGPVGAMTGYAFTVGS